MECDSETYVYGVIIRNNYLLNKKGIGVSAVAANQRNILIENNRINFSMYYGITVDTGDNVRISGNDIRHVAMSATNPDDTDSNVKVGNISIPSDASTVVIDGTTYYYVEVKNKCSKIELLDTTHLVLLDDDLNIIVSGSTQKTFSVYIATATPGAYSDAYRLTVRSCCLMSELDGIEVSNNTLIAENNTETTNMCIRAACNIIGNVLSNCYSLLLKCNFERNKYHYVGNYGFAIGDGAKLINNNIIGFSNFSGCLTEVRGDATIKDNIINDTNNSLLFSFVKGNITVIGNKLITTNAIAVTQNNGKQKGIIAENNVYDFSKAFSSDNDLTDYLNNVPAAKAIGSSSERPTLHVQLKGFEYYDTTLSKKIMWNGSAWVNVDGSSLI